MIQENEIRVGNILYGKQWSSSAGGSFEVDSMDSGGINISANYDGGIDRDYTYEKCQGIPITPDILEKIGFEKRVIDINGDVRAVIFEAKFAQQGIMRWESRYGNPFYFYLCNSTDEFYETILDIQYLHQLQNLYYSLTQTELNVQL